MPWSLCKQPCSIISAEKNWPDHVFASWSIWKLTLKLALACKWNFTVCHEIISSKKLWNFCHVLKDNVLSTNCFASGKWWTHFVWDYCISNLNNCTYRCHLFTEGLLLISFICWKGNYMYMQDNVRGFFYLLKPYS